MPNFDVVWTYDNGIVAALVGYKNMSTSISTTRPAW